MKLSFLASFIDKEFAEKYSEFYHFKGLNSINVISSTIMQNAWYKTFFRLGLIAIWLFFGEGCRTDQRDKTEQLYNQPAGSQADHHKHHHHKHKQNRGQSDSSTVDVNQEPPTVESTIDAKVRNLLAYIQANGHAPDGYVGGRSFGNFENHLPKLDAGGKKISYQEWDVNPKIQGKNRGTQRLITGSDGRAYYTGDHYNSFTEIK